MEKCHTREVKRQRREHRNNKNFILYREQKHKSQAITLMQLSESNNQCVPFHPPTFASPSLPPFKICSAYAVGKECITNFALTPGQRAGSKVKPEEAIQIFQSTPTKVILTTAARSLCLAVKRGRALYMDIVRDVCVCEGMWFVCVIC